jgi:hypothetical protein
MRTPVLTPGLQLIDQFISPADSVLGRHKFEGKAPWLLTIDAGIVARQVFEQPSPDIFRFTDEDPPVC